MEDDITRGTIRLNGQIIALNRGPYIPARQKHQQPRAALGGSTSARAVPVSPLAIGNRDTASHSGPGTPHDPADVDEEDADDSYNDTDGLQSRQFQSEYKLAKVRAELSGSFFENLLRNTRQRNDLVAAEKGTLESISKDPSHTCPRCSTTGGHTATVSRAATVVVVTLAALHELELPFLRCCNADCKCLFAVKPTQLACIPGSENAWTLRRTSDVKPLWFHMDLLSFLDSHHYHAKSSSVYGFVQVMEEQWLRAREVAHGFGPPEEQQQCWQPSLPVSMDTVRRQISDALREYQHLLTMCDNVVETLGLEGWPNSKHNPCSACDPKAMQVHFDLCFGLPMLRRGYSLEYSQPPNTRLIVPNSEVQEMVQEQPLRQQQHLDQQQQQQQEEEQQQQQQQRQGHEEGQEYDGQEREGQGGEGQHVVADADGGKGASINCSEFKADKLVAYDSRKYLITAMAVAVCRHGHVLLMANCTGGEKHGYAILCLYLLLLAGLTVKVWWYDINCRWERSFRNWLAAQSLDVQQRLGEILLPVPPFHLYAHREACRVLYGHLHMPVGRGTGENCERTWAELAHQGLVTKYMSGANRECRIERAAHLLNRAQDRQTSSLLTQTTARAATELAACKEEMAEEVRGLQDLLSEQEDGPEDPVGAARDLVQEAREAALASRSSSSSSSGMSAYGQYVKSRFTLERMLAVEGKQTDIAPPLSLVFSSSSLGKVKFIKAALQEAKQAVARLAEEHLGGQHPDTKDSRMQLGINHWLFHELRQRQSQVSTILAHARYADSLVQKCTQRPSQQKKVLARKQALLRQAEVAHRQLLDWVGWAGALREKRLVSRWEPEVADLISSLAEATLTKLQQESGAFPWLPKLEFGAPAQKAAHKVFLLECLEERLKEELQLLEVERARLLTNLQQRIVVLEGALGGDVGEGHRHLVLRELRRCRRMLARATQLFLALEQGGQEHSDAAADAYIEVEGHADEDT